jgi:hypothetical protein
MVGLFARVLPPRLLAPASVRCVRRKLNSSAAYMTRPLGVHQRHEAIHVRPNLAPRVSFHAPEVTPALSPLGLLESGSANLNIVGSHHRLV